MLLNYGIGEDSWESLGLQGDPTSPPERSILSVYWKDWYWSWNSNTVATWCEGLTHLKRLWCWESLRAGGEGDDRGWDGWMGSSTLWTWVWLDSGSWWWTGRPGVLRFMGSQRVEHDWATELNWTVSLYVCSTVDSPVSGYVGCFPLLTVVIMLVMDPEAQIICLNLCFLALPRSRTAGSYANSIFNFFF